MVQNHDSNSLRLSSITANTRAILHWARERAGEKTFLGALSQEQLRALRWKRGKVWDQHCRIDTSTLISSFSIASVKKKINAEKTQERPINLLWRCKCEHFYVVCTLIRFAHVDIIHSYLLDKNITWCKISNSIVLCQIENVCPRP